MTSLVIRNGLVLDGSGGEPIRADVAVADGRIERIGDVEPGPPELDAGGRYVAPGFIDIHSHSDYTLLVDPRAASAIHQGVTLEVVGNCGHGCFPIRTETLAARAIYGHSEAVPVTWESAAGYFERLEEARPAVNVLSLLPNGQLRLAVVGLEDRPASPAELREMSKLLEEGLEQGAWGYSTGLEYAQERGATEAELTALCGVAARRGGMYATHTRRRDAGSAEAVEEAVRTARESGARLQLSHLIPRSGEEEGRRCIAAIDAAAESDLDVAFDMHTRLYGTTFLHTVLPPAILGESPERQDELLRDRDTIATIERYESILSAGGDWERIVLLDNDIVPRYNRRSIASIAAERGQEPLEAICGLLREALPDTSRLMVINHCHTEAQQREAFTHPLSMPGSDATTLAPDGPLAGSTFHGAYTWAAWFYRFMVTQENLLSPGEAVRRLTSAPAERVGLTDRGVLRKGAAADVVVFDPAALTERGTTYEPNQLAAGVTHVLVNGVVTLRDGEPTGDRAGQVLRRT
ncbi:MAG TPA: amidohydrolase family protein [Gaiellaceae bacterium]